MSWRPPVWSFNFLPEQICFHSIITARKLIRFFLNHVEIWFSSSLSFFSSSKRFSVIFLRKKCHLSPSELHNLFVFGIKLPESFKQIFHFTWTHLKILKFRIPHISSPISKWTVFPLTFERFVALDTENVKLKKNISSRVLENETKLEYYFFSFFAEKSLEHDEVEDILSKQNKKTFKN